MAENKKEIVVVNKETIKDKIYHIRGQKIMLDFELAEIYGYTTTRFNEQVKNNLEKFDDDFMFQLTKSEFEDLISKKSTSSWGGRRKLPYAFTEQGIYILMTVLRGELAIKQSKALIRMFKQMKDFIVENQDLISSRELVQMAIQTNQNTTDITKIKEEISVLATKEDLKNIMDNFIDSDSYKHFLFMDGEKLEADIAYTKIYKSAKKSIYVVDNYIGLKTLELIRAAREKIDIIIFSDNIKNKDMLTRNIWNDFKSSYPNINIKIKVANKKYHDRYIAIDYGTKKERIYHCGCSSKDAGNKVTSITRIEDIDLYHPMFDELLLSSMLKI